MTSAQAKKLGIDGITLRRLVDAGLLDHVTHGVYGVPAAMASEHLTERAAWLRLAADRPGWEREPLDPDSGVLSHRSAAAMHDLGDLVTDTVEITVPRRRSTRDPHVRLRVAHLTQDDVTRVDGLPVTTVERTISDLMADHTDGGHVGDVIAAAHRRRLVHLPALAQRVECFAPTYGIQAGGTERGTKLVTRLLEQVGYEDHDTGATPDRGIEHGQQVSAVAQQLVSLDPHRLSALAALLASMTLPTGEFLSVVAGATGFLTAFAAAVAASVPEDVAQQIREQTRQAIAHGEPMREFTDQTVELLRPTVEAAWSEETRHQLAENVALLAAAQIAPADPDNKDDRDDGDVDGDADDGDTPGGVDTTEAP